MIQSLWLKNFASYSDITLDMSKFTMVEIAGLNGSGKSYLLESVVYALYGKTRDDIKIEEMMKNNSEGSMEVGVRIKNIPEDGDILQIVRGRSESGTNKLQVWLNNETYGKNTEAQTHINNFIGMDKDLFLITCYFGMGENDALMSATPATRLDTLQKIAKVSVYEKLRKRAAEKQSACELEANEIRAALSELSEVKEEIKVVKRTMISSSRDLDTFKDDLEALIYEKAKLDTSYERVQSFVRSKLVLESEVKTLRNSQKEAKRDLTFATEDLELNKEALSACNKNLETYTDKSEELEKCIKTTQATREIIAGCKAILDNLMGDAKETCPTCMHKLSKADLSKIDNTRSSHETTLQVHQDLLKSELIKVSDLQRSQQSRSKYVKLKLSVKHQLETANSSIIGAKHQIKRLSTLYTEKDTKLSSVLSKLSKDSGNDLSDRIEEVDKKISICRESIGIAKATSKLKKQEIKSLNRKLERVVTLKDNLRSANQKFRSYELLVKGWSRYGIPMDLTEDLREELEERATELYQNFSDGSILVERIVDRGKPGIDFILSDSLGDRRYKQLSKGQRSIMYLSVRIALTDIVSECIPFRVDWLTLDEVTDGLDPEKRDSLMVVIKKILKNRYSQIFSVCHVATKAIFPDRVKVWLEDRTSQLEVI